MASTKIPISQLPLPPSSHILTHNLTPEPIAKNATELFKLIKTTPSTLRKSRASHESAHFSYLTPLPLQFPYRIAPPPIDITNEQRLTYIEKVLVTQEPTSEAPSVTSSVTHSMELKKYHSLGREDMPRELLSVSPTCLRDYFPCMDVGDALEVTGMPSLSGAADQRDSGLETSTIRQELVSILSGDSVLMSIPTSESTEEKGYAPWSLRYSGHQFGSWAGQLGDGRAISILETLHPHTGTVYELQLKGAGRTPFSRGADGLAVLRSSIREYLVAEAMYALGVPTTRSLSLISLPTLAVAREQMETAAIVCRVAESFIRIGNFQALNSNEPDTSFMMFGGGGGSFAQQPPNYEALRILGEWVFDKVMKMPRSNPEEPWAKKLVWESARRNALMVAGWQATGFMHGVMNTDNISILGITIDYGPYAFMDVFSHDHICNHSDETGRYSYKLQPTMIVYALRKLLESLGPIIGAELESGKAVTHGWADGVHKGQMITWGAEAQELQDDLEAHIMETFTTEYTRLMRQRLALKTTQSDDFAQIFEPLLDLMEKHAMDFHSTFRHLCSFRPSWILGRDTTSDGQVVDPLDTFIKTLLVQDPAPSGATARDIPTATKDWLAFLERFAARINSEAERAAWAEASQSPEWEQAREAEALQHNPRFVLRQWVLEEIIASLHEDAMAVAKGTRSVSDPSKARQALNKVLHMCANPFEPWGVVEGTDAEAAEERRLCGTGPTKLLGFQCSCSS